MKKIIFFTFSLFFMFIFLFGNTSFPADTREYKLQPTDVLKITVHEQDDLSTRTRITQDGYITFPLVGKVYAQGLTVQQLEAKLKELLELDYLVNAQVLVFIEDYHAREFSVIGEVNEPGNFKMPLEKDIALLEAIALAGGYTKDAKINETTIIRLNGNEKETIKINVNDIMQRGERDKNITIQPNDVIIAPKSFWQVSVIGEVNTPGKFDMPKERPMTVLEAVAMAGGYTKEADVSKTVIMRETGGKKETIKVNLKDITNKGTKDVVLEPDDVVFIPESFF